MLPDRSAAPEVKPAPNRDSEVARAARILEWLKAELVAGTAGVLRAAVRGREDVLLDSLADLVMHVYLLARRLGLNWTRLEMRVEEKLRLNIADEHQLEQWYGDLTALEKHFRLRGRWPE